MLTLRHRDEGGLRVIALVGELDLANADAVESALEAGLGDGRKVVVDMSELTFIDSTGIALLVATVGRDPQADRVRFVPSSALAVTRVLALTGLDARLPLADGDPAAAQASA